MCHDGQGRAASQGPVRHGRKLSERARLGEVRGIRAPGSSAMKRHYDVVILGAGVGALAAAALLARRSWRVLVLGQGYRPATYAYEGVRLARRPFSFLAHSSPAWGRVLVELAQSQTFRRRVAPLDPMFQILAP